MQNLIEIQKSADSLSQEDKAGLVAHLLASFPSAPLGPNDVEVDKRDTDMDNGTIKPISHDQFLRKLGKR